MAEFESEVAELVKSLDSNAQVDPNAHVIGQVSGIARQLDALVTGTVAGQKITIAIEAKRYGRRVSIGTVDEFVGKMMDVGCDRGLLFAAGGFTEGALARARKARLPVVGVVHLKPKLPKREPVLERGPVFSLEAPWAETPLQQAERRFLDEAVGQHRTTSYDEWFDFQEPPIFLVRY
ncbi:restriction endonuclease [Streptomyces xanthochromogenes]|uniref:Restriction endonuclease type IV Mrr domain-containing protein n=1 Tax=Streptomyces xanthochromogenes TaxID=67384 RepID=A0ABQ3AVW9_9ACTN|nr:restriction endonuclease [Streptomyces xanthochromogenes]GGY65573.1 hypothetical protein GCM10010326_70220 [Streptomyces xanthochromogenes]